MSAPASPVSIERVIRDNIDRHTGRRLHDVEVHCNDQGVIIKGEAASYHVKQLALISVLKTVNGWGGFPIVHDIRVKKPLQPPLEAIVDEDP